MEEVDEVSGGGTFAYDIGYAVGVALSKSANAFSKMSSGELAMLG